MQKSPLPYLKCFIVQQSSPREREHTTFQASVQQAVDLFETGKVWISYELVQRMISGIHRTCAGHCKFFKYKGTERNSHPCLTESVSLLKEQHFVLGPTAQNDNGSLKAETCVRVASQSAVQSSTTAVCSGVSRMEGDVIEVKRERLTMQNMLELVKALAIETIGVDDVSFLKRTCIEIRSTLTH
ncbi:hypothetical protein Tco_0087480 [Tanacetum coccineum]